MECENEHVAEESIRRHAWKSQDPHGMKKQSSSAQQIYAMVKQEAGNTQKVKEAAGYS